MHPLPPKAELEEAEGPCQYGAPQTLWVPSSKTAGSADCCASPACGRSKRGNLEQFSGVCSLLSRGHTLCWGRSELHWLVGPGHTRLAAECMPHKPVPHRMIQPGTCAVKSSGEAWHQEQPVGYVGSPHFQCEPTQMHLLLLKAELEKSERPCRGAAGLNVR